MKTLLPILLGAFLALASCESNKKTEPKVDLSAVPCTCGSDLAAIEGCAHPDCVSGKGNPGNPDCVCATLDLDGEDN